MSRFEVRVPESLLLAPLPPWVKMIWISIRSYQGNGDTCRASYDAIGERATMRDDRPTPRYQVSKAVKMLECVTLGSGRKVAFLARGRGRELRCITPEIVAEDATSEQFYTPPKVAEDATLAPAKVAEDATIVAQDATFDPTPEAPKVAQDATAVAEDATIVAQDATPSKSQLKPKEKANKRARIPEFDADSWQMVYGTTAFDRLQALGKLPSSLARNRERTIAIFAYEFDKLHRLDKHTTETIAEVTGWLFREDSWWMRTNNFRSVTKYRDMHRDGSTYFEVIKGQCHADRERKPQARNGSAAYNPVAAYDRIHRIATEALAAGAGHLG